MAIYTTEIASEHLTSDNPVHQRLLQAYYLAMPYVKGKTLELGCGQGRGVALLAAQAQTYLAIDKIASVVEALKTAHPNAEFRQMVFPPFAGLDDNAFDTIVSFQVIEHIKDDRLFLEEIHRVLKPGGVAVVTTPNIKMSLSRNPWHEREYTHEALSALAKSIFPHVEMKGMAASDRMTQYHEQNRASVRKIMRFDVFNLQYRLPAKWLRLPYEFLNRRNRNKLLKQDNPLVQAIGRNDFYLREADDKNFDLFCIMKK